MSVKRLSFYFQQAMFIIICDHKPLEKPLKGKTENNKVNNCSIELTSHKLNIHYIKGKKNSQADCLSRVMGVKLTEQNYKSTGKDF